MHAVQPVRHDFWNMVQLTKRSKDGMVCGSPLYFHVRFLAIRFFFFETRYILDASFLWYRSTRHECYLMTMGRNRAICGKATKRMIKAKMVRQNGKIPLKMVSIGTSLATPAMT